MSYAQARWRAGSFQVVTWLAIAGAGWAWGIPAWMEAGYYTPLLVTMAAILINLPADWYCGYWLPARYGRSLISQRVWWLSWVRGAGIYMAVVALSGAVVMGAAAWGTPGAVGAGAGLGILLMGGQYGLLRITAGGIWEHMTDRGFEVETAAVQDREFTGGLVGIPGQEVQVFPAHWQATLAPAVSRIIQVRRHGAINLGLYGQGALLALAAHILLWTAAVWLCGVPLTTGAGWLRAGLIYTVVVTVAQAGWLPRLGREAAFAMDKWVYYQQFDADALRASIQEADRLLEPAPLTPAQAAWVYARPTAAARLARMAAPRERAAAWQPGPILRYLSWAGGNLAARSGPMISGHPANSILAPDT